MMVGADVSFLSFGFDDDLNNQPIDWSPSCQGRCSSSFYRCYRRCRERREQPIRLWCAAPGGPRVSLLLPIL